MFDLKPPIISITLAGKGGVGKSLYSLAYLDVCDLNGIDVDVMQLDDQSRLEKAIKRQVVSLNLRTAKQTRIDPMVLTKTFAPMHEMITNMNSSGRSLHLDVGATQQHSLFDYSALIGLDEDLVEFGVQGIIFVLVTADTEAILQAARSLETARTVLPSLNTVIVLNERDGAFNDLPLNSDAHEAFITLLSPMFAMTPTVRMPKIPAGSWQCFERQCMRLLDVVAMDTQSVINETGLSRPEAKLARGDVQAVFDVLEQGLACHLPFIRSDAGTS